MYIYMCVSLAAIKSVFRNRSSYFFVSSFIRIESNHQSFERCCTLVFVKLGEPTRPWFRYRNVQYCAFGILTRHCWMRLFDLCYGNQSCSIGHLDIYKKWWTVCKGVWYGGDTSWWNINLILSINDITVWVMIDNNRSIIQWIFYVLHQFYLNTIKFISNFCYFLKQNKSIIYLGTWSRRYYDFKCEIWILSIFSIEQMNIELSKVNISMFNDA